MGSEHVLLTPETIEKIVSNSKTLKSMLDLDEEAYNIAENGEGLIINFVLCDVVIENVFDGCAQPNDNFENYNRITIYFKPLCELSKDLSSIKDVCGHGEYEKVLYKIMKLLNKEHMYKQKLIANYKQLEKVDKQLEQQLMQKAIIETKINDNASITKVIPKKPFNKRLIFSNKKELINLQQDFQKINDAVEYTEQSLNILQQNRHVLEADINKNIDKILEILSENFIIEKIDSQ